MLKGRPRNVFIWFAVFLLVFIVWLSWTSEWEYDEAWSYNGTYGSTFLEIIRYSRFRYANNHFFNSLYFHLLQNLHLKHMFFYRILSIASFVIYSYYIWRLLELYKDKYGLAGKVFDSGVYTLVFLALPFAMYFSMGRGYALAMAMFAASLYYFNYYMEKKGRPALVLFLLFGSLASMAIFSFLFVFVVMAGLIVLYLLKDMRARSSQVMGSPALKHARWSDWSLVPGIVLAVFCILYIFRIGRIINNDPNIIGGSNLMINGSGSSLISFQCFLGYLPDGVFKICKIVLLLSALPACVLMVRGLVTRREVFRELVILAGVFVAFFVSHVLVGSKYPLSRSLSFMYLLIYFPLFIAASRRPHFLYAVHFCVATLIGLVGLGTYAFKVSIRPNTMDVLKYVRDHQGTTLLTDVPNPNIDLENKLYFQSLVKIESPETPAGFKLNDMTKKPDFVMATTESAFQIASTNGYGKVLTLGYGWLLEKQH